MLIARQLSDAGWVFPQSFTGPSTFVNIGLAGKQPQRNL